MKTYLYEWQLEVRPGLGLKVEISALSACEARRTVRRFLDEHRGAHWTLQSVERTLVRSTSDRGCGPSGSYVLQTRLI